MKLKKLLALAVCLTGTFLLSSSVLASDITIKVNGSDIIFEDQEPEIVDGRTLVPLRGVFDSMGFDVEWDETARSAKISNSIKDITMTENIKRVISNTKTIDIDVAPQIIGGRLMIPLRAVAESIDASVEWDGTTRTVSIIYVKADGVDESVNNIGMDEQQYMKTIISLKEEMREITDFMPDAVLSYAAGMGNFNEVSETSVPKVEEEQFEALEAVLDKFDEIEPVEGLRSADENLKEYVKLIRELIKYSKDNNPKNVIDRSNSSFMEYLEVAKMNIEELNSDFGNNLIEYFMENKVLWEDIYGEGLILNFLLY